MESNRDLRTALGNLHGMRALDFGTGDGETAKILADCGAAVTTVDAFSSDAPEAIVGDTRIRFLQVLNAADVGSTLPFENDSYDRILARYVLQQTRDPLRLLRIQQELFRVLKPGGVYVLQEDCGAAPAVGLHTPVGFCDSLREAGFMIESMEIDNEKSLTMQAVKQVEP